MFYVKIILHQCMSCSISFEVLESMVNEFQSGLLFGFITLKSAFFFLMLGSLAQINVETN